MRRARQISDYSRESLVVLRSLPRRRYLVDVHVVVVDGKETLLTRRDLTRDRAFNMSP